MGAKLTQAQFLDRAKMKGNQNVDLSDFVYINKRTKGHCLCKLCGHKWMATADSILGGRGCNSCGHKSQGAKNNMNTDQFISKAKLKHGSRYDYSLVEYTKAINKVKIICKDHGEFEQAAYAHVYGQGCLVCSGKLHLNSKQYANKATKIHGGKYDYSKVNYVNSLTKISITCIVHGEFMQVPSSHLQGIGCPKCKGNIQKQAYINLVSDGVVDLALKFGIANNSDSRVYDQNRKSKLLVTQLAVWEFPSVDMCKNAERMVKSTNKQILTKEDLPDGYTETSSLSDLEHIIRIYEEFGGVRIKSKDAI